MGGAVLEGSNSGKHLRVVGDDHPSASARFSALAKRANAIVGYVEGEYRVERG